MKIKIELKHPEDGKIGMDLIVLSVADEPINDGDTLLYSAVRISENELFDLPYVLKCVQNAVNAVIK